jgi:hypothetical protein
MAVPDGFDLWNYPWHPDIDYASPMYKVFLEKAKKAGYDVESGGFKDAEDAYYGFFLMGVEAQKETEK